MSDFRIEIRTATTGIRSLSKSCEVTLINPYGAKRWFLANDMDQAKIIAGYWADFLDVDNIDTFITPVPAAPFIQLSAAHADKTDSHETPSNNQDSE